VLACFIGKLELAISPLRQPGNAFFASAMRLKIQQLQLLRLLLQRLRSLLNN
jgi:hypothetical protein